MLKSPPYRIRRIDRRNLVLEKRAVPSELRSRSEELEPGYVVLGYYGNLYHACRDWLERTGEKSSDALNILKRIEEARLEILQALSQFRSELRSAGRVEALEVFSEEGARCLEPKPFQRPKAEGVSARKTPTRKIPSPKPKTGSSPASEIRPKKTSSKRSETESTPNRKRLSEKAPAEKSGKRAPTAKTPLPADAAKNRGTAEKSSVPAKPKPQKDSKPSSKPAKPTSRKSKPASSEPTIPNSGTGGPGSKGRKKTSGGGDPKARKEKR